MQTRTFVETITKEAGKILLSASTRITARKAGGGNWVTEADLVSEKHIIGAIQKNFPSHAILSEETVSTLEHPEKLPHLWIIDPLDGTSNFTFGVPLYCVSVAYMEHGKVLMGAIYDPVRDELFIAERGKGAFVNGKRIKVRDQGTLKDAYVYSSSPYTHDNFLRVNPKTISVHKQGARISIINSAVLGSAWVAAGRGSLYFEYGLKPWDIAAASLLVEEAGGVARAIEGALDIFSFTSYIAGGKNVVQSFIKHTT